MDVQWANGLWSNVSSTIDGQIIYPTPNPISTPNAVFVNGIAIPLNWQKVRIPYSCSSNPPMPGFCLEVEVRCNPCLEIKIKLVPCW